MRWEGFTISSIFLKFCVNNKVKKYITKGVGQEKANIWVSRMTVFQDKENDSKGIMSGRR